MKNNRIVIDIGGLFSGKALIAELDAYISKALSLAGAGNEIVLTGAAPIWLYLKVAHALHGRAKRLIYQSPVSGDVVIFDHDPFEP